jgi:hypothetical protein
MAFVFSWHIDSFGATVDFCILIFLSSKETPKGQR